MKNYTNKFGLLAFTIDGKDYISDKGIAIDLPSDSDHVKRLIVLRYFEETKPSKTQK